MNTSTFFQPGVHWIYTLNKVLLTFRCTKFLSTHCNFSKTRRTWMYTSLLPQVNLAQNLSCRGILSNIKDGGTSTILWTTSYHQQSWRNLLAACHVCGVEHDIVGLLTSQSALQECLGKTIWVATGFMRSLERWGIFPGYGWGRGCSKGRCGSSVIISTVVDT